MTDQPKGLDLTRWQFAREQEPTDEQRAKFKAAERRRYIRQRAPTILAGMLADPNVVDFDVARGQAITEAGLIFDETEDA